MAAALLLIPAQCNHIQSIDQSVHDSVKQYLCTALFISWTFWIVDNIYLIFDFSSCFEGVTFAFLALRLLLSFTKTFLNQVKYAKYIHRDRCPRVDDMEGAVESKQTAGRVCVLYAATVRIAHRQ